MSRSVVYNPDKVNFAVDGHRVRDYGDGTFITIEHNEDNSKLHTGATGEYIFAQSNNKSAVITLTLLQNSLSLVKLEELKEAQEPFPVSLVDMNDDITKSGEHAMVQSVGPYTRGIEAEDVEVKIEVGRWE